MFHYSVAGVGFSSDTALDGLPEGPPTGPCVRLTLAGAHFRQPSPGITWCQVFTAPGGVPDLAACGRSPEGYVIRRHGVADYVLSPDAGEMHAVAAGVTTTPARIAEEFLGTALPLVLALRGHLGLHASAIELDGGVVAFTGVSECGKSTLAGYLQHEGCHVLADDYLGLDREDGRIVATSGIRRTRPRLESVEALRLRGIRFDRESNLTPAAEGCREVRRVYALPPRDALAGGEARIELLGAAEASVAIFSQLLRFDPADRALVGRQLDACAALVNRQCVRRLLVPSYDALDDVLSIVRRDLIA